MSGTELTPVELQVFLNVVAATGRDPEAFAVAMDPDGHVHVTGPSGTASYAAGNWITRFSRQLQFGFFASRSASAPIRVRR
jgi:hypothetical protein